MRISDWSSDVCSSDLVCDSDRCRWRCPYFLAGSQSARVADRTVRVQGHRCAAGQDRGALHGRPEPGRTGRRTRSGAGLFFGRSEEHTSELQSLMRISYAVFCLKKKKHHNELLTITSTE